MALDRLTDYATIISNYTDSANYGVIRLQMYNGIAKQKSTLSTPLKIINIGLMVSNIEQKRKFDDWYGNALEGGVGRFLFRDFLTKTSHIARFMEHPLIWNYVGPSQVWTTTAALEYKVL